MDDISYSVIPTYISLKICKIRFLTSQKKKKKKVASDFERGKGKRKMKTHFGGINLQAICCFRKKH